MKPSLLVLSLACALLAACATNPTTKVADDDEYTESEYSTGSNIPHKTVNKKMTDEEKQRLQDDLTRQMAKAIPPSK